MRSRSAEFHGALTDAFAQLLSDIFIGRRIAADGVPAELVIAAAVPSLASGGGLRLALDAKLAPVTK
jgi:hypothetical protein